MLHRVPTGPASRRPTVADVRDQDDLLSVSFPYKKDNTGQSFLFTIAFSHQHRGETPHRSPPASHHLAPPFGNSSRLANPRFLVLLLP
jgi:hypothetical protein